MHRRQRRSHAWRQRTTAMLLVSSLVPLCAPSYAGTTMNGTTTNGTTTNGTTTNGIMINGTTTNGITINGTTTNGTTTNGKLVQGRSVHGRPVSRAGSGPRLAGVKLDPVTAGATFLEIHAFHGDKMDAWIGNSSPGSRRVLPVSELIGMQWVESHCSGPGQCVQVSYRVVDGERDHSRSTMPAHGDNSDVWLFEIEHTSADSPTEGDWQNLCQPDSQQLARAMFLDGQWRDDGSWNPRGYTIACTSGVIAKCARNWGYKPWKQLRAGSGALVALQPLHQACTRAARADYCGDGVSHTRNGTLIDIFDPHGLNVREQVEGFDAEAGFTAGGAAWIARPRWPRGDEDRGTHVALPTCTRPKQVTPERQDDVLIYVRSLPRAPQARD